MAPRNDEIYLEHILEEINRVESFLEDWTREEFLKSDVTSDHYAVVRSFEIIGEAASKIGGEYRKNHSEVPWRDMIDMRNKVIHEYLNVEYSVVWKTAKEDLPMLKGYIQELLNK